MPQIPYHMGGTYFKCGGKIKRFNLLFDNDNDYTECGNDHDFTIVFNDGMVYAVCNHCYTKTPIGICRISLP